MPRPHSNGPTNREEDVLVLLANGMSAKQIAREFGINTQTVKVHLTNMREKIGAHNSPHLVALAIKVGWLRLIDIKQSKNDN